MVEPRGGEFAKLLDTKLMEKLQELEVEIVRLQEQKKAADAALLIARAALEHNQSVSNEWRKENIDQRALFMTQEKAQALINYESQERRALEGRLAVLEKAASGYQGGKTALDSVWIKAIALAGIIIGIVGIIQHFTK